MSHCFICALICVLNELMNFAKGILSNADCTLLNTDCVNNIDHTRDADTELLSVICHESNVYIE